MTMAFQKYSSSWELRCGADLADVKAFFCRIGGGRWELMDKPTISEEATMIMAEKMFGYHKPYTGDDIYTFRNGKTYEILSLEDGRIIK